MRVKQHPRRTVEQSQEHKEQQGRLVQTARRTLFPQQQYKPKPQLGFGKVPIPQGPSYSAVQRCAQQRAAKREARHQQQLHRVLKVQIQTPSAVQQETYSNQQLYKLIHGLNPFDWQHQLQELGPALRNRAQKLEEAARIHEHIPAELKGLQIACGCRAPESPADFAWRDYFRQVIEQGPGITFPPLAVDAADAISHIARLGVPHSKRCNVDYFCSASCSSSSVDCIEQLQQPSGSDLQQPSGSSIESTYSCPRPGRFEAWQRREQLGSAGLDPGTYASCKHPNPAVKGLVERSAQNFLL